MGWGIREAVREDLYEVVAFLDEHLVADYFMPYDQVRHVIEDGCHRTWLCVADHEILGIAIMSKGRRTLNNLLVAPCERNRGIGGALLLATRCEMVRAKLDVTAGDPREFYFERGYRSTGKRNRKGNIEVLALDVDRIGEAFGGIGTWPGGPGRRDGEGP